MIKKAFGVFVFVTISLSLESFAAEDVFEREVISTRVVHATGFQIGEHKFLFAPGSCEEVEAKKIFENIDSQIEKYGLSLSLDDPSLFNKAIAAACEKVDQELEAKKVKSRQLAIKAGINIDHADGSKGSVENHGLNLQLGRSIDENRIWDVNVSYNSYLFLGEEKREKMELYGAYKVIDEEDPRGMMFLSVGGLRHDDIGLEERKLVLAGFGHVLGGNDYRDVCGDKTQQGWWTIKGSIGGGYIEEDWADDREVDGLVVSPWASYERRLSKSCLLVEFKGLAQAEEDGQYSADFGMELTYSLGSNFYLSPRFEYLKDTGVAEGFDETGRRLLLKIEWKR